MIILDTHIWYWWINLEHHKISQKRLDSIEQADNVAISTVSCLEILWLVKKKTLILPCSIDKWFNYAIEKSNLITVPVSREIAVLSGQLPEHHKDPLDRIIIATAIINNAQLISVDSKFPLYQELNYLLI